MPRKAGFIALAVLTLALPHRVAAQVPSSEVSRAVGALQAAFESLPAASSTPRLKAAVEWLVRRSKDANPSQISEEYLRTISRAAELLRQRPNAEVMEDVTSELEAKVEHCRTLGIGMGGSVLLRVNTRRGAQTVSYWQVFYLLKIYERMEGTSANIFPNLSTPAQTRLDPGRYWIWGRDPVSGRISDRVLVRVVGQTEFRLDLPIP